MICQSAGSVSALVSFSATCRRLHDFANSQMYAFDAQRQREAGPSALHWAAFHDNLPMAKKALQAGMDPNRPWFSRYQRAHVDDIMRTKNKLTRKRLDDWSDSKGYWYWTAMDLALARGSQDMFQLLLDHNARFDVLSKGFCSCIGHKDLRPNPAELPMRPWPPLHTALCFGRDEMAKCLLIRGGGAFLPHYGWGLDPSVDDLARPRRKDVPVKRRLALNMAAFYGCVETLEYVLSQDRGADHDHAFDQDPNAPDYTNHPPLCYAVFGERPEVTVPVLIRAGAHPDCVNLSPRPPGMRNMAGGARRPSTSSTPLAWEGITPVPSS